MNVSRFLSKLTLVFYHCYYHAVFGKVGPQLDIS